MKHNLLIVGSRKILRQSTAQIYFLQEEKGTTALLDKNPRVVYLVVPLQILFSGGGEISITDNSLVLIGCREFKFSW